MNERLCELVPVDYVVPLTMEEAEDDTNIIEHLSESRGLRLVSAENRDGLLPDPELKALIEKMKGKQKVKRGRLTFDDGPEAA